MPGFFVETTQSGLPEFLSVSQAIRNEISLENEKSMQWFSDRNQNPTYCQLFWNYLFTHIIYRLKSSFCKEFDGANTNFHMLHDVASFMQNAFQCTLWGSK